MRREETTYKLRKKTTLNIAGKNKKGAFKKIMLIFQENKKGAFKKIMLMLPGK